MYKILDTLDASFRGIPGKMNPANEPSHRLPVDVKKLQVAIRAILAPYRQERNCAAPLPNDMGLRQQDVPAYEGCEADAELMGILADLEESGDYTV